MFPRDQNQPRAGERERKEIKTQMTKEHHVQSDRWRRLGGQVTVTKRANPARDLRVQRFPVSETTQDQTSIQGRRRDGRQGGERRKQILKCLVGESWAVLQSHCSDGNAEPEKARDSPTVTHEGGAEQRLGLWSFSDRGFLVGPPYFLSIRS